jgi:hypothetical protein
MQWSIVIDEFKILNDSNKYKLFRAIKNCLFGESDVEPTVLVTSIREAAII